MKTYIALLRGINVSGHNMIKMTDLKFMFEEMNFKFVRTYLQSGNVVFGCDETSPAKVSGMIESGMLKTFGFQVPVIIRTGNEMEKVFSNNPFLKDGEKEIERLAVTFLSDIPEKEKVKALKKPGDDNDAFIISGKEIFLHCPDGFGRSKLTINFFEKKLNVTATARNWKTVCTLTELSRKM